MHETTKTQASTIDAYSPQTIARMVRRAGIVKAEAPAMKLFVLAILAGAFIALGALFYTLVVADSALGAGPTRLLGGVAFSLGLILVVIAGAELFTGNALMVIALADGKITLRGLLRNWGIVFSGNFLGALIIAGCVVLSGVMVSGALADKVAQIAITKLHLSPSEAFFRGILCNILVCLAVWMSFAAHSVTGKVSVIILPIAAFVGVGFEHSVANMYVLPVAMLGGFVDWDLPGLFTNLVFVTFGNIVGGGVLVAASYWSIFIRNIAQDK
jgi:formate transporter